jgi:hypothetical protein
VLSSDAIGVLPMVLATGVSFQSWASPSISDPEKSLGGLAVSGREQPLPQACGDRFSTRKTPVVMLRLVKRGLA